MVRTTNYDKLKFDKALGETFACNIPFRAVESKQFRNFVEMLHPGYKLPTKLKASEGSTKPPLPCKTRWSSSVKILECFIKNWQLLRTVVSSNPDYFSKQPAKEVQKILSDLVVYQHSEEALKSLKPVFFSSEQVQGDHVTVADSVAA